MITINYNWYSNITADKFKKNVYDISTYKIIFCPCTSDIPIELLFISTMRGVIDKNILCKLIFYWMIKPNLFIDCGEQST